LSARQHILRRDESDGAVQRDLAVSHILARRHGRSDVYIGLGAQPKSLVFDFSGTCPGSNLVDSTGPFDVTKAFGNAPRFFSKVRNPGVDNLDFSLQKDVKIPFGEQTRLTFSADFFNLPNHAQFAEPDADPLTGYHPRNISLGQRGTGFGTIGSTSSLPNRIIQLGLHLYF
jgi:hypothetical protein